MSNQNHTKSNIRRGKLLRKGLRILLIILLVFSATSVIVSAVIFRVLFPRKDGLSPLHWTYEEVDAEAYPREAFSFPSDGNTLRGYRYPADAENGCIVIVNGIFDGADAHLPEIMFFVDHGWSVVTWDATGVGESEGRWAVGLQQIRQDLCAYLSFTESPPGREKLPLILYGHSAGGYAALAALSEGYDVDGVISVCGFNSPTDMMMYHSRENVGVLADLEYPFFVLENLFLFGSDASDTALEGINAAEIPILLIEGDSDERFPPSLGLIRYADSFQNPNVEWTTVSAPWRGEHATPWLTEAGAAYVCAWSDSEPPDKEKANELDPDFMNLILDFCDRIIKKDGLQP